MLNARVKTIGVQEVGDGAQKAGGEAECYVVYKLRDISEEMVKAWEEFFTKYLDKGCVQISHGDIFRNAPAADAIVSPANSFGFMDGGIDMAYSKHFGWQMQERLQEVIDKEKDGELLVGDAVIIPAYGENGPDGRKDLSEYNEGQPIKFLVSAPTMRVPCDVSNTVHAYLAFRAVILAVEKHNQDKSKEPIKSVLCPGLGTAVGRMPKLRCAKQMLMAYETLVHGLHNKRRHPQELHDSALDHAEMTEY